jgi:hypothetical protein
MRGRCTRQLYTPRNLSVDTADLLLELGRCLEHSVQINAPRARSRESANRGRGPASTWHDEKQDCTRDEARTTGDKCACRKARRINAMARAVRFVETRLGIHREDRSDRGSCDAYPRCGDTDNHERHLRKRRHADVQRTMPMGRVQWSDLHGAHNAGVRQLWNAVTNMRQRCVVKLRRVRGRRVRAELHASVCRRHANVQRRMPMGSMRARDVRKRRMAVRKRLGRVRWPV